MGAGVCDNESMHESTPLSYSIWHITLYLKPYNNKPEGQVNLMHLISHSYPKKVFHRKVPAVVRQLNVGYMQQHMDNQI